VARGGSALRLAGGLTEPRTVLRGVGLAGTGVGVAFAVAPRLGLRVMGLESSGRGVSLLARLFASRDLGIGAAVLLAAGREEFDVQWLDLVALFQVTDLAFTAALYRSGRLSRRALAVVLGTAGPTLVAALAARLRAAEAAA
jgi:hypothetical protein